MCIIFKRSDIGKSEYAVMAQLAEHVLGKDEVTGSNPVNSSNIKGYKLYVYQGFGVFYLL